MASTPHLLPDAHPAHALLSVAHALLSPATAIAQKLCAANVHKEPKALKDVKLDTETKEVAKQIVQKEVAEIKEEKSETLLLEGTKMPDNDVDLKDVVDAINRLCEDMSNSYEGVIEQVDNQEKEETVSVESEWVESIDWTRFEQESIVDRGEVGSESEVEFLKCKPKDSFVEEVMNSVQNIPIERLCSSIQEVEEISPVEETAPSNFASEPETKHEVEFAESLPYQSIEVEPIRRIEGFERFERCERWSDSASSISLPGQAEDPEMMSDVPTVEPVSEMYYTASSEVSLLSDLETTEKAAEDERKGVIAGHVAAMRERFESMTRANTPCPDAARSVSPSLDARNVTPSPDLLG